ncbi:MAG: hypothetical protein WCX88_03685 [Patescibacteria group bacterium]|jgi:hypothetical protein
MSWNKAEQLLQNEIRKINVKIDGKKKEIHRLELDRAEIEESLKITLKK